MENETKKVRLERRNLFPEPPDSKQDDVLATILEHEEFNCPPTKRIKLDLEESAKTRNVQSSSATDNSDVIEVDKSKDKAENDSARAKFVSICGDVQKTLDRRSTEVYSPTTNLPNYNIDGNAPFLHFSPQKRVESDWLTKMRREKCIMRKMRELANDTFSDNISELNETKTKPSKRHKSSAISHMQSPLMNFFKATSSNVSNQKIVHRTH